MISSYSLTHNRLIDIHLASMFPCPRSWQSPKARGHVFQLHASLILKHCTHLNWSLIWGASIDLQSFGNLFFHFNAQNSFATGCARHEWIMIAQHARPCSFARSATSCALERPTAFSTPNSRCRRPMPRQGMWCPFRLDRFNLGWHWPARVCTVRQGEDRSQDAAA